MPARTSYKAGDEVDAKCTKCKMVLAHTIVAMVGAKIAKVRCNTCQGVHAYRAPPTASEATAARRRNERKSVAAEASRLKTTADEFDKLSKTVDLASAERYTTKMELAPNQVVDHPKFGLGIVTELREDRKAHIAFSDGGRILVYGRG